MGIEWSGLSPELLVRLDRAAGQPLRAQLEAALRDAIRSGRLRGGERLPSSRELARELGMSRGIVQECYSQLLAEGYLTSRSGSATRVAHIEGSLPVWGAPAPHTPWPAARMAGPRLIADFRPGVPDLSSFPRADWAWAVREACGAARGTRRVPAADAMGLRVGYVPVDDQGLVVSALAASDAQAVVVTPAHQSPTGVVRTRRGGGAGAGDRVRQHRRARHRASHRRHRRPVSYTHLR